MDVSQKWGLQEPQIKRSQGNIFKQKAKIGINGHRAGRLKDSLRETAGTEREDGARRIGGKLSLGGRGGGRHRVSGWELLSVDPNCHSSSDHRRRIPKLHSKEGPFFSLPIFIAGISLDFGKNIFFPNRFAKIPMMGTFDRSGIDGTEENGGLLSSRKRGGNSVLN